MSEVNRIFGQEKLDTRIKHGQVYMATHKGEQKLPFMNRLVHGFAIHIERGADLFRIHKGRAVPQNLREFLFSRHGSSPS